MATPSTVLVLDSSRDISNINVLSLNTLNATNIYGQIKTSNQPYITSVGILNDLLANNPTEIGDVVNYINGSILFYSDGETMYLQPSSNRNQSIGTSNRKFIIKNSGYVGIGTYLPSNALEINDNNGICLRLSNNASTGNAINYTDLLVSANGTLNIQSSNNQTNFLGTNNSNNISIYLKNSVLNKISTFLYYYLFSI